MVQQPLGPFCEGPDLCIQALVTQMFGTQASSKLSEDRVERGSSLSLKSGYEKDPIAQP